ncbi:hypothetical protein X760_28795 [Mesorhizobium sp. LSHC422A00]|nr:hypothetical protein X760_28795 [Mesorhizobium sp. LSHC422A00]
MRWVWMAAPVALLLGLGLQPAFAVCNISDAKLEEAVLKSPELRNPENRYLVRDLRTLRDAAWNQTPYGVLRWARSAVDFLLTGACLRQEFEQ